MKYTITQCLETTEDTDFNHNTHKTNKKPRRRLQAC